MRIVPKTVTEPATEPVTLSQLRAQVRVDDNADDALLFGYLIAARRYVEKLVGRVIVPRTVRAVFEAWPCAGPWSFGADRSSAAIELLVPATSIDAVTYIDTTQTSVAWTGWVARTSQGGITRVRPASGQDWPTLGIDPLITLDATSGFTTVPEPLIQAICMVAAHFYANRESVLASDGRVGVAEVPMGARDLIAPYRWRLIG